MAQKAPDGLPPGFSYLRDIDPTILQDMRYASRNNFTGKVLPGYDAPECVLRTEVATALAQIQKYFIPQGFTLKVYDCYRPARAVRAFGRWAHDLKDNTTKTYYPRLSKSRLFGKGYIARRSGHSIGTSVDITLVRPSTLKNRKVEPQRKTGDCTAPQDQRAFDSSIDMGTGFDCFDVMSHTLHPSIRGHAQMNRYNLRRIMKRFGFANYRKEWWHYSYKKRTFPRVYHDFPIQPRQRRNSSE